jgi:hypothetical protein
MGPGVEAHGARGTTPGAAGRSAARRGPAATPAAQARPNLGGASGGVVAKGRSCGTPAYRPPSGASVPSVGRARSQSRQAGPSGRASPRQTALGPCATGPTGPRSWRATPAAWRP